MISAFPVLFPLLLALASPLRAETPAPAGACQDLHPAPPVFQVAWISPVRDRVGAGAWLDVVRVADLRLFVQKLFAAKTAPEEPAERVLQLLGLAGPKGLRWYQPKRWKVTFFDVQADWLCRPVLGAQEDAVLDGVPACPARLQKVGRRDTGCGYTLDRQGGERGLDHFRVQWRDAARGGFCVMPLERFVSGA